MLPSVTNTTSKAISDVIKSLKSTYRLLYFDLHGRGEMARILWAYGGVNYLFRESGVVERYLAKKFNLDKNEWGRFQIEQIQSSKERNA
ncbi:hypothetical protein BGZ80_008505, partial [Entomortierella chlamydospora]